jgi:hypothetical protein
MLPSEYKERAFGSQEKKCIKLKKSLTFLRGFLMYDCFYPSFRTISRFVLLLREADEIFGHALVPLN